VRESSLASRHPRWRLAVNLALLAALALFAVGLFAPLMTLEKFYVFSSTVSLFSALGQLYVEGQWSLGLLLTAFSVLLPLAKLGLLAWVWNGALRRPALSKVVERIGHYGKWSMLDVFVVALLVVSAKLGAVAHVQVHSGVLAFAASVLLTMGVTQLVFRLDAAG